MRSSSRTTRSYGTGWKESGGRISRLPTAPSSLPTLRSGAASVTREKTASDGGQDLPVESGRTLKSRRMMELRRYRDGDMDALTRLGVAAFGGSISDWEKNFDPAQRSSGPR